MEHDSGRSAGWHLAGDSGIHAHHGHKDTARNELGVRLLASCLGLSKPGSHATRSEAGWGAKPLTFGEGQATGSAGWQNKASELGQFRYDGDIESVEPRRKGVCRV